MKIENVFRVKAKVYLYADMPGSWHFVSLPKEQSASIKSVFGELARGWGSLPVVVTLGKSRWKTSIFPDKKIGSYLLPLKASVRKKEGISAGDTIIFSLEMRI